MPPGGPVVRIVEFHDVVCVWCHLSAVRLRRVAEELGDLVTIAGKVLPGTLDETAVLARWPSHEARRAALLESWARAKAEPGGEGIDLAAGRRLGRMPLSLPAAAALKGAEELAGMAGHLVLRRRLQEALFLEGRDIGDAAVVRQCASAVGLDPTPLAIGLETGAFLADVHADSSGARALGIHTAPAAVFDERWTLAGPAPVERYRAVVAALLDGHPPDGCGDLGAGPAR